MSQAYRVNLNEKKCATCRYWEGEREIFFWNRRPVAVDVRSEETRPPPAQAVPHGSRGKKSEFLLRVFRAQGVPRNLETPCSFLHRLNRGNFSNDKQSIGITEGTT